MKAIYLLNPAQIDNIYGPDERSQIEGMVDLVAPPLSADTISEHPEALAEVEAIFSGWGMRQLDEKFLAAAPNLKVVFYGSGSIKAFATDAAWDRGIVICSAWAANAIPVAEFNLAQILLSNKRAWSYPAAFRESGKWPSHVAVAGNFRSTVGIVSMGMTGRLLRGFLAPFDHHVIAYDPFLTDEQARELDVEPVSLPDLFRRADVVSLNTPLLPETIGLVTGELLASMKPGATFINTARGAIVDEPALIKVFRERPDLIAILDVTHPEPPAPDSPLLTLPNVILTPHIAGSQDHECRRMGQLMVDECHRYLANEPLQTAITREAAARMA
jgi:phosphoglycerate dehydrogenase-like enzyme